MEIADAKWLKELEGENVGRIHTQKSCIGRGRFKKMVSPSQKKTSHYTSRQPWVVLGASGVSLSGVVSVNLSISRVTACAQANPTA